MAHERLAPSVQNGLAFYYVTCAVVSAGFAIYQTQKRSRLAALLAFGWTALFVLHAAAYGAHSGWVIPERVTRLVDDYTNAVSYFVVSTIAFAAFLVFRKV